MKKNNIVRIRVTVKGTRPLLQHCFGPDAIPLEKREREGVAGNDPGEWKRTCMVTPQGQLYILDTYIFGCFRNGARNTKRGKSTYAPLVASTLQVEEKVVLIDRFMPEGEPKHNDYFAPVYVDVCGVVNRATKARNVRYRLACSPGWQCTFTIQFDKTMVPRDVMKAVAIDAGRFGGLADGLSVGNGRFEVISYEELTDAQEEDAEGGMVGEHTPEGVGAGRKKVRSVPAGNGVG